MVKVSVSGAVCSGHHHEDGEFDRRWAYLRRRAESARSRDFRGGRSSCRGSGRATTRARSWKSTAHAAREVATQAGKVSVFDAVGDQLRGQVVVVAAGVVGGAQQRQVPVGGAVDDELGAEVLIWARRDTCRCRAYTRAASRRGGSWPRKLFPRTTLGREVDARPLGPAERDSGPCNDRTLQKVPSRCRHASPLRFPISIGHGRGWICHRLSLGVDQRAGNAQIGAKASLQRF
jgi:hypothetical protein